MPLNHGPAKDSTGAAKNAPDKADDPAGSRGALLSTHARTLDSRLRVAAQSDRQATRRAAAHVVQLARRIARLLPRVPTLLPVLPDGGRDARVRHYVLQAQPVAGTSGTRILTISTHSVLRYGELDGSGKAVLWNEYDPMQPVAGWDLEVVLERLAGVLGKITDEVEQLEARVAERAQTLNSLLHAPPVTNRPLGVPVAPKPTVPGATPQLPTPRSNETRAGAPSTSAPTPAIPAAPAPNVPAGPTPIVSAPIQPPAETITYGPASTPTIAAPRKHAPHDDLLNVVASEAFANQPTANSIDAAAHTPTALDEPMPELALIDLAFGAISAEYEEPVALDGRDEPVEPTELFPILSVEESAPVPGVPDAPTAAEATAEREKRERRLFQHLRAR